MTYLHFFFSNHADKFKEYSSSKHPNKKFHKEKEKDVVYLDVNIYRENRKFTTYVYKRKTFSVIYNNFKSFMPETC